MSKLLKVLSILASSIAVCGGLAIFATLRLMAYFFETIGGMRWIR